jgi:uncharacterized protein YbcC (UPF0753/DUF2309 family)
MNPALAVQEAPGHRSTDESAGQPALEHLAASIEHAAHYLPAQGPITVFIHHNTLHAFEEYQFNEGVERGSKLFGCQPYLTEDRYREELARGRILPEDVAAALLDDMGDDADTLVGFMGTRFHFRQAMLRYPLRLAPAAELRWFVAETDALARFRSDAPAETRRRFLGETKRWILRDHGNGCHANDPQHAQTHAAIVGLIDHYGRGSLDSWSETTWEAFALEALWRIVRDGVHRVKQPPHQPQHFPRLRDHLLAVTGEDVDVLVNEVLIRFCAAFLDQGLSRWGLPARERGFFRAFCALYSDGGGVPDAWLRELPAELTRLLQAGASPLEIVQQSLNDLGVREHDQDEFLTASLLALRGWGGMIRQLEQRSDRVAHPIPPGSLVEFLAVQLVLERQALAYVARDILGYRGPLSDLGRTLSRQTPRHEAASIDQRAFQVFQLAQVLGWLPPALAQLTQREWTSLVSEIEAFPALARRRVFHSAYERRHRIQSLDAIAQHAAQSTQRVANPAFQVICCLDEREESFRRHLEEVAPSAETFGAAGFFGVPMYYRGAADAHFVPLCPIVIRPQHWVAESVDADHSRRGSRRARTRRALGVATHGMHVGSRSFAGGALLATGVGALASIPLVARVLFPRLTAQIRESIGRFVEPPPSTHLDLERGSQPPSADDGCHGFTLDEMTTLSERLLRDISLIEGFAPLVVVLGHGSRSHNNPHNSAYNCGACGGGCGGPNARALARMLNDSRVRANLVARGIAIPDDTWFVGGWHNTCNDGVTYFDQALVPPSHAERLREVIRLMDQTCDRNAHERCRRFVSAPLNMTPAQARRHVEGRSEDLAQTRPECGHATNAVCVVARRSRTRGLYMDRRTFLTSYDPTQDDEQGFTLTRLLSAAIPVCGGINLEYYFSYVDNVGFGCGTKLPHNVTSLLGVMDGHASDLRTGLPWQMVEIHEPVRLLFVIETTPTVMLGIFARNPGIARLCENGWVQVATLDPSSNRMHLLKGKAFEPYEPQSGPLPSVESSIDWYRGQRDHLGYAVISPAHRRRGATHA